MNDLQTTIHELKLGGRAIGLQIATNGYTYHIDLTRNGKMNMGEFPRSWDNETGVYRVYDRELVYKNEGRE